MAECDEIKFLDREMSWLLDNQVQKDIQDIHQTLLECSRRFPYRMGFDDRTVVKPQRDLLSTPNNIGQIKCIVTLMGDSLCDADISFKYKSGKDINHIFKTKIGQSVQWNLQQVKDAANHLAATLAIFHNLGDDHVYKTAQEVLMLLEEVMNLLILGRACLAFPKRKSIDELLSNTSMQHFQPPVPNDVAVSFYIHSSKLILAIYHLSISSGVTEIISRHQTECSVKWLNEAMVLYTLAIEQCQLLQDKITKVQAAMKVKVP